jgi:reactive intermediate/imine deaminase
LAAALLAGQAAFAAEYLTSEESRAAGLPFSEAVRTNGMLYLSGQIPVDPDTGNIVEGDIEAQARQTMDNIKAVLERYGSSMDKVVKCTVMIRDMSNWGRFNEVYVTYFPGPKPARSAFGASGLALGAMLEVECWAAD